MDGTIYALLASTEWLNVVPDLQHGEGRFGWSYVETADLRELQQRIESEGWESLSAAEANCYNGQQFLLDIRRGDYVIYVNLPKWGQCTLARVDGTYNFQYKDDDFNHRFPVDPDSVRVFDRNADFVHPSLRARLKLPRRWWTISEKRDFLELLQALENPNSVPDRLPRGNAAFLARSIDPYMEQVTQEIHRTYPNKDLELLIGELFRMVPGVTGVEPQRGRADKGADLVVRFESGLPISGLQVRQTLLVQVKSYEGTHADTGGISDLERAFSAYEADMGLLVSTATTVAPEVEEASEKLSQSIGKPIKIMAGADLARFVLAYGTDHIQI